MADTLPSVVIYTAREIVTLDPAGMCRFVVGEAIYSEWEIRRMALDQLFFEEREDEE